MTTTSEGKRLSIMQELATVLSCRLMAIVCPREYNANTM